MAPSATGYQQFGEGAEPPQSGAVFGSGALPGGFLDLMTVPVMSASFNAHHCCTLSGQYGGGREAARVQAEDGERGWFGRA